VKPAALAPAALPPLAEALERTWAEPALDPAVPRELWDAALCAPLADVARRPAKELRALVCGLGWWLAGGRGPVPEAIALAVDGLHTGSLIVDDVEDRATVRRGAPAVHILHGEATAINAGTWLYFWALEQLAELELEPARAIHVHRRTLAVLRACHEGQALDLRARVDRLAAAELPPVCAAITRGKTAALVGLAMELAALAANAAPERAAAIADVGHTVGTALQQLDDLGSLGRARRDKGHEDLRGRRVTWPWAWLAGTADDATVVALQERAGTAAAPAELDALADELQERVAVHGRLRIRATADAGLARARAAHGEHPALAAAAALVSRMEDHYG
jgi:geranylgeranyl pyrophosphate synthase